MRHGGDVAHGLADDRAVPQVTLDQLDSRVEGYLGGAGMDGRVEESSTRT